MNAPPSLTVIVPVYNEAENLASVIPVVCAHCQDRGFELIWVNDGSSDESASLLQEHMTWGKVQHHKVNRGYGGAIKTGIRHASGDFVVTIDADGQHVLEDIQTLHAFLIEQNADMVVGKRSGGTENRYRKLGKRLLRKVAGMFIPFEIEDINSGMKLYRRRLVSRYLSSLPDTMAYSDVVLFTFLYRRHKVVEHPIHIRERMGGTSTISTRTAFQTLYEILSVVMLFNPIRIFLPLSICFFVVGVLWSLPFLWIGRGVPVASGVLILTSVFSFLFGLLAQQLSGIRGQLFWQNELDDD